MTRMVLRCIGKSTIEKEHTVCRVLEAGEVWSELLEVLLVEGAVRGGRSTGTLSGRTRPA